MLSANVGHFVTRFCLGVIIGAVVVACGSDGACPTGHFKDGKWCRLIKDAGEAGVGADEDAGDDDHLSDDAGDASSTSAADGGAVDASSDSPVVIDASGAADTGSGLVDATSAAEASADAASTAMCSPACGPKEACRVEGNAASCVCADSYTKCGTTCVDQQSDPMNCGACGYACEVGLSCKQGQCEQKIHELVLGGDRSCALYEAPNGAYPLKCWGDTTGKLFRDTATEATSPRSVVGVPVARSIVLSRLPSGGMQCVVPSNQDIVRCWGQCQSGCGNSGAAVDNDAFFDNAAPGVARASADPDAACALTTAGTLQCWGKPPSSPLSATTTPTVVALRDQSFISHMAIGSGFGCALKQAGHVLCWGTNSWNQLGAPSPVGTSERTVMVTQESGAPLADVVAIDVGGYRTCAITSRRELWCWGNNSLGSLGSGDRAEHVGAVRVDLPPVAQVGVGTLQTCAIVEGGRVYCWGIVTGVGLGGNARGDSEDGSFFTRPVEVPGVNDAIEIRSGTTHVCARRRSGRVVCWGGNESGQLGDGTAVLRLSPTPVIGLY